MKHARTLLFLPFLLFCFSTSAQSQISNQTVIKPSLKFGKPSPEELAMTAYPPDTSAVALILYRTGVTKYKYQNNEFSTETEISVKIKILKPEGVHYADVSLPYYVPEKSPDSKEKIYDVEAYSYNLENGKTVRKATGKEFIVRERRNEYYMQLKFSVPSVQVGTVIEYTYKHSSDFFHRIENWEMQDEIPTLLSQYIIEFPRIFDFNAEIRGRDAVDVKTKEGVIHITVRDDATGIAQVKRNVTIKTLQMTCTAYDLPAIRQDEPFIWCPDDHKIQISFELKGTQYPGSPYKPYTQNWEDIDAVLMKDESFGERLELKNPFREEMKALQVMQLSKEERVGCLLRLLRQKMAWDGKYGLYCKEPSKVISKGSGSSADLNFILISMLRESGMKAYPVLLSQRNTGMLPVTYPSLQKLNTFVVGVEMDGQKLAFIDSSMGSGGYLNVLPVNLTAPKARIINSGAKDKWVDLSKISTNQIGIAIDGAIGPDASVSGTCKTEYSGQHASRFRQDYFSAKDSAAFVEKRCEEENCRISVYQTVDVGKFTNKLTETMTYNKTAGYATDEFLYINPLVFPYTIKNQFTQVERQLPVELPFAYTVRIISSLTLPEGYSVEELPKPGLITLGEKDIYCRYSVQVTGNTLNTSYLFTLSRTEFAAAHYKQLQTVWENIVQKNNEMVVLKKNK